MWRIPLVRTGGSRGYKFCGIRIFGRGRWVPNFGESPVFVGGRWVCSSPDSGFSPSASSGRPRECSILGNPHFATVWLQVILGGGGCIFLIQDFAAGPSGRPRGWDFGGIRCFPKAASGRPRTQPNAVGTFRGRPRVLFRFWADPISGNARTDLGNTPDSLIQDFRRIAKMDLGGGYFAQIGIYTQSVFRSSSGITFCGFRSLLPPPDKPRVCPKGNPPFGHGWADLGVVLNVVTAFRTTARQTSGVTFS